MNNKEKSSVSLAIDEALAHDLIDLVPKDLLPGSIGLSERAALAVQYLCTENYQLRRRLTQREQQLRELAVESLIWGTSEEDSIKDISEKYGAQLEGNVFFQAIVRIPGLEGDEHQLEMARCRMRIRECIDDVLSPGYGVNHVLIRKCEYILVSANVSVQDPETRLQHFRERMEDCAARLKESCGKPVICIGPLAQDTDSIRSAFTTLLDLREYSMARSDLPTILTMDEFPGHTPLDPNAHPFTSMAVEKQYINAIVSHDFDLACQLTREKMDELLDGSINGQKLLKPFIESRFEATADLLMTSLTAIHAREETLKDQLDKIKETSDIQTIYEVIDETFDILENFFNGSDSDINGTAGKVIKFVAAHYQDPSLSVEIICDEMGKSRSYLSRMFKENTGMNLLDFLHTTRITEAKRLLTETSLSVSDIGERVGYYSGWTLARVFKRYEGITPSTYREAFRRGDVDKETGESQ